MSWWTAALAAKTGDSIITEVFEQFEFAIIAAAKPIAVVGSTKGWLVQPRIAEVAAVAEATAEPFLSFAISLALAARTPLA